MTIAARQGGTPITINVKASVYGVNQLDDVIRKSVDRATERLRR